MRTSIISNDDCGPGRRRSLAGALLATTALVLAPGASAHAEAWDRLRTSEFAARPQFAQAAPERVYAIPPGPLSAALNRFADESSLQLVYDAEIARDVRTNGVQGAYAPEQALRLLLAGSGLEYRFADAKTITLSRAAAQEGGVQRLAPINVEGVARHAGQYEVDEGFKAEFQTSATKTPLPIRETPQSISVVTQDLLEARQVQDLGQSLETAAGVNQYSGPGPFAGKSPFGFDEVQIRGIALDGALDIREDGFVSPTFFFQPDLVLYERIEAVKGPSSALYGRGSAGGFINRVRKKPSPQAQVAAAAEIGSFDHYRAEGDATGPLLGSDKARGRLTAAYQDAGSFVDGVESERAVVAPSVEVDLSDSTRLLLQGSYQQDKFVPNPGFPLQSDGGGLRAPDISRSLFVGLPSEDRSEWEALTGVAQLEQRLGDDWLATVRLNRTSQDSPVDIDSYAYGIAANGDVGLYSSAFQFDTDVWSGEFKLDGKVRLLDRPANVTLGVDRFEFEQARTDAFAALGSANIYDGNFGDFPTMQPTALSRSTVLSNEATGAYAQLHLRPFERLGVILGGRYDWADSSYLDRLTDIETEKEDRAFTGRAGLVFEVQKDISAYAVYAQSFSPNLFSVARDGTILDPEEGVIYEAGLKTEWFHGRLSATAAVFRIEREKVPVPDPSNMVGEFFSISGGRQRSDGFEVEVNGEPLPGWKLTFAGALLDSEFIDEDDPFFGTTPAGAADWQIGLFTSYELQGGPLKGLGFGAGLFAIDDRGVSTFQAGGTLEGYERVDLTVFYNGLEPLSIALQVRNVLDEKYVEGADRAGAYAQFGSPRAALLTVRARW